MAIVYLGKDNKITISLTQDGVAPAPDVITKAALWIPGTAFSDNVAKVIDSDGPSIDLIESATKIIMDLGSIGMRPGTHLCYLTIYDATSPNGIAWDKIIIKATDWPSTV